MIRSTRWFKSPALISVLVLYVPAAAAQQIRTTAVGSNAVETFKVLPGRYPKYEQGFLLTWKFNTLPSDAGANVFVYNRDESLFGKTRIWIEGASFLRIQDATVGKDGQIAAVGFATTASGTFSQYLAIIPVSRGSATIVQLSPFEGQAVGLAPDGTIWVFGADLGPTGDGSQPAPDHFMVRHFGADGVLKDEHLLRSDFPCELGRFGPTRVVASADRIGFFSSHCRTWVELSPTGQMLGRWTWNAVSRIATPVEIAGVKYGQEQQAIMNVALTSSNELYGVRMNAPDRLFHFDRKTSQWIAVPMTLGPNATAPYVALLFGAEADNLVYATTTDAGFKLANFQPPKAQ